MLLSIGFVLGHDKIGGTTIHANGQRVQRQSAWLY